MYGVLRRDKPAYIQNVVSYPHRPGLSNPGIARFPGPIRDIRNILNARAFMIFRMAVMTLSGYPVRTLSGPGPSRIS